MSVPPISIDLPEWFAEHLIDLRTLDYPSFVEFLRDPPVGRTEFFTKFADINRQTGFKRSGPAGWTYFPVHETGQMARVSYTSKDHLFHLSAVVNLVDHTETETEETFRASEYALVTVDNLSPHGKTRKRGTGKKVTVFYS